MVIGDLGFGLVVSFLNVACGLRLGCGWCLVFSELVGVLYWLLINCLFWFLFVFVIVYFLCRVRLGVYYDALLVILVVLFGVCLVGFGFAVYLVFSDSVLF